MHDEHAIFTRADWRREVWSDNTQLGYWEWVDHRRESEYPGNVLIDPLPEARKPWDPNKPARPEGEADENTQTVGQLAESALSSFRLLVNLAEGSEPVSDLITNLLHLCDQHGIDKNQVVARAINNYLEER